MLTEAVPRHPNITPATPKACPTAAKPSDPAVLENPYQPCTPPLHSRDVFSSLQSEHTVAYTIKHLITQKWPNNTILYPQSSCTRYTQCKV